MADSEKSLFFPVTRCQQRILGFSGKSIEVTRGEPPKVPRAAA
jgi:hypothetical protein